MTKIDLFDLYQKLISLVNQAQGGFIRPQLNFENWVSTVNNELFRDMFSDYEKSQQLSDEYKRPFLKRMNCVAAPRPGDPFDTFVYPSDYEYFSSAHLLYKRGTTDCVYDTQVPVLKCDRKVATWDGDPDYKQIKAKQEGMLLTQVNVELVDNQRFDAVLNHRRKGPRPDRPYITQFDGGFRIAPKGIGIIVLDYLRTPTRPVFAYTPGPSDTVIYNLSGSTQMDWSVIIENEFLPRLAMKYGVYVRDESLYKLGINESAISK